MKLDFGLEVDFDREAEELALVEQVVAYEAGRNFLELYVKTLLVLFSLLLGLLCRQHQLLQFPELLHFLLNVSTCPLDFQRVLQQRQAWALHLHELCHEVVPIVLLQVSLSFLLFCLSYGFLFFFLLL